MTKLFYGRKNRIYINILREYMKKIFSVFLCAAVLGGCSAADRLFGLNYSVPSEYAVTAEEAAAQYGSGLSLQAALVIAEERNLELQKVKLKQEIAAIDKQMGIGNLLPQVHILAGYERSSDILYAGIPGASFGLPHNLEFPVLDKDFYAYSVSAQIPVFVPSLWFLVSARQKGEDMQVLLTSLSEKLVQIQAMSEYFYCQALQAEQKTLENEYLAAQELVRQAEISLKTESILPWELEQAKAYCMAKAVTVRKNRREQDTAELRLLQTLNFPFDTELTLQAVSKEVLVLPPLEDCILQALEGNEKWKITGLAKDVQADVKRMAISNFLPKIVVGGTLFGFDNAILTEGSGGFLSVAGLLSIFNGFKNVNEYRKALRQEKISEIALVQEYWALIAEIRSAYAAVQTAEEVFRTAQTNLSAMRGKFAQRSAERKYGAIGLKEYYEALKEFHEAESFYDRAYFQYRLSYGTLNVAMGQKP